MILPIRASINMDTILYCHTMCAYKDSRVLVMGVTFITNLHGRACLSILSRFLEIHMGTLRVILGFVDLTNLLNSAGSVGAPTVS